MHMTHLQFFMAKCLLLSQISLAKGVQAVTSFLVDSSVKIHSTSSPLVHRAWRNPSRPPLDECRRIVGSTETKTTLLEQSEAEQI